ncbi:MAG: valine--tRNA ligase [Candidatus Nanoarchaeia archaeon]|nr:valine--tRNA ligase [Candidatus Nanoarchaeia archaeon]
MVSYEARDVEKEVLDLWQNKKIFSFDKNNNGKVYSVDTPPPTVSGKMHIGHAFGYIQHDAIIRFKRMKGYNVFFPFGTDDNGLPTEKLVEKENKLKASLMDRQEFIKLCNSYLENHLGEFVQDWKNIGVSADFDLCTSTISKDVIKLSQRSFIDLYEKQREYRKKAPTMWCPVCETAISQVELEDVEVDSTFNDIVFKVEMQEGKFEDLIIATTRPELLPSIVAVFVNPQDKRYEKYVGKNIISPYFNDKVVIMSDDKVDMQKGTGVVMCCTFGDQTDIEWYRKYNLELKVSFTKDGKMTSLGREFEGLKIKDARKAIIEKLKEEKLLVNQKPIKHMVNVHERCGTEIEILDSYQWFIKYLDLKEKFLEIGEELNWYPLHLKNRYDNWVKGLQWDWCISRQRFFGIPFPVWYCQDCEEVIIAPKENLPVDPTKDKCHLDKCPKCGSKNIVGEKDVLDTWATSSLTPQIYKSLIGKDFNDVEIYSQRFQGHDIISFWLFNTIVKSYLHNQQRPWDNVAINGWVLDSQGKKMAKSKGNVIDPRIYLEKYSADMMRYWASSNKLGDDVPFKENEFIAGKKTLNKLWNALNFVFMNVDASIGIFDYNQNEEFEKLESYNKWIISNLEKTIKEMTLYYENFELSKAKASWEKFFWTYFCDNYLEMVKDFFFNPEKYKSKEVEETKKILITISYRIVQLVSPILSFITEKIYQEYFYKKANDFTKESIHLTLIPEYNEVIIGNEMIDDENILINFISEIRKYKNNNKLSLKEELKKVKIKTGEKEINFLKLFEEILKSTLKINSIEFEIISNKQRDEMENKFMIDVDL